MKRRAALWMYERALRWYPQLGEYVYLALRQQVIDELGCEIAAQQTLASHQAYAADRASRQ